ncbi:MAG TPA: hypothetical protein VIL82_06630 [Solirubrobacteraceae bacterium]
MSGAPVLRSRIAVFAVIGSLASPAGSLAAGSSGSPLTPGIPQNTGASPTTVPAPAAPVLTGNNTVTSAGSSSLSGGSATAIAIGALVVLAGISLFIWRDARKRAPVRSRAAVEGPDGRSRTGSKPKTKPRKLSPAERRRRKRGKAR